MSIIYPPLLASTIPAFTKSEIAIPFKWNPAVGRNEVKRLRLIIKDLKSNIIGVIYLPMSPAIYNNAIATFNPNKELASKLTSNQYYKFQMSYEDSASGQGEGTLSAVSIGRCVGNTPMLSLAQKDLTYVGQYNSSDLSEAVLTYQFKLFNTQTNELLQDSGQLVHDTQTDSFDTQNHYRVSQDEFDLLYVPQGNERFKLIYSVTTINGYFQETSVEIEPVQEIQATKGTITATEAIEQGSVKIVAQKTSNAYPSVIERSKDGKRWEKLITLPQEIGIWEITDYTVEAGEQYQYGLRDISTVLSESTYAAMRSRITTPKITPQFEHLYLTDGTTQMCIQFNPNVSTFKETVLEQKSDTIGSQYPFIFRNGDVRYKEISISGLISYLMDNNELFATNEELGLPSSLQNSLHNTRGTTDLTAVNITAERKFKLKALAWLNNGKAKLFRSPTEGNYLVRLTNISLSPEQTLGRMLHSFSSTGYEICGHDLGSMLKTMPELIQVTKVVEGND